MKTMSVAKKLGCVVGLCLLGLACGTGFDWNASPSSAPPTVAAPLQIRLLPVGVDPDFESLRLRIASVEVRTPSRTLPLSSVPVGFLELTRPNHAFLLANLPELEAGEEELTVTITFAPLGAFQRGDSVGSIQTGGTSIEFVAQRSLMTRGRVVLTLDMARSLTHPGLERLLVPSWRSGY